MYNGYIYIYIFIYIYIYIYMCVCVCVCGVMVTNSAADAKGPRFNSSVARTYLGFNSRASTLTGKQCKC